VEGGGVAGGEGWCGCAYAMARATHADMRVSRRYLSDADFLQALDEAPPGIIDPR
jgi:hypothetical protein